MGPLDAPESRDVVVEDGTRLRVLVRGEGAAGRPVVLVHGLASNATLWDGVARRLEEAGHPSAAVDLRSHGASEQVGHGHGTDHAARDVLDVAAALGMDRPVVVGQSWGGTVAVALAARPDQVAGVVAVDGGAIDLRAAFDDDWEACRRALAPPAIAGTPRAVVEAMLRRAHPDFEDWAVRAQLANFAVRDDGTVAPHLPLEHHLDLLRSLWDASPRDALAAAVVPTLLLLVEGGPSVGDGAGGAACGWLDAVVEASDQLRLVVVRDRVHDVHAQDPDLVARHVLELLAEVG